jgi:hypothetical protein
LSKANYQKITVLASNGTGPAENVEELDGKWVHLAGTFVATVQFQCSLFEDQSQFINVGAALTAPGLVEIPQAAKAVRAVTSGFSSGAPLASLAGFNTRSN